MVDSLQATQHATAVQNTPTCTTLLSPQLGESDNMPVQSISDSSSNALWEESLVSIDTVLQKYPKLYNQSRVLSGVNFFGGEPTHLFICMYVYTHMRGAARRGLAQA